MFVPVVNAPYTGTPEKLFAQELRKTARIGAASAWLKSGECTQVDLGEAHLGDRGEGRVEVRGPKANSSEHPARE
jgi:hypothetical protein